MSSEFRVPSSESESRPRAMAPVDEQLAVLMSGVEYGDALLRRQMERELRTLLELDRPLRVYLGVDPTASSLTLGHTVPLRKLRQFQEFGHHAIFLIGDYTALIGDPSDKNKLRPMLTQEDIKRNEETYAEQVASIMDLRTTELRHNSEWLAKLTFPDIISLMSKFTVAEMLRRDNFRKRFDDGDAVFLHEFLYALMQGYDAFALECDVQVGGTEQLFNLMAGRKIQQDAGQRPHVPVTMPILVGLDGKERMSKSKGNHIGVSDSADEQYGKAMSLPDEAVMDFFVLATNVPRTELDGLRAELARDPMGTKKRLARTIVSEFWGEAAADAAGTAWERRFQRHEVNDEDFADGRADLVRLAFEPGETYARLVARAYPSRSNREIRRLFETGSVSWSRPVADRLEDTVLRAVILDGRESTHGNEFVRVGKRQIIQLL